MGWQSWDSNWKDYGANRPDYSNYIFIATPEDMKKELQLEDIGKELFFLTKHAFCETCDKTLKAYGSEEKAKAQVEKHLGFKKYAGHKAFVKTVDFSEFNKCTTADIVGTKANIQRNQELRDSFFGKMRGQIKREIETNEELIQKVMQTFAFTKREDDIPECPRKLEDAYIYLSNEKARGKLKISDFEGTKQLFDGTWGKDREDLRHQDLHDRAGMLMHYMNITGNYSRDVYSWDYPINYDNFVGHDTEQAGDCHFCHKKIESWNDLFDGGHISDEYVHRDCYKHYQEQQSLEGYAERYAKEQEKVAQEVTAS